MFWKRQRAARRQRVLEELLWLDPVDRERRIVAALAAGDFSADELDSALSLVHRLDTLRGMAVPPGGRLVASHGYGHYWRHESGDQGELGIGSANPRPDVNDAGRLIAAFEGGSGRDRGATPTEGGEPTALPPQKPSGEPIGIPVVHEPVGVPIQPDYVGIPVAPESSGSGSEDVTRAPWASADAAVPAAITTDAIEAVEHWAGSSNTGSTGARDRPGAIERRVAEAAAEWQGTGDADQSSSAAQADEAWPSISWLRPR